MDINKEFSINKDFNIWMKILDSLLFEKDNLSSICKKLDWITYSHAHKVIRKLEYNNYIITGNEGRIKTFELTEKGRKIAVDCNKFLSHFK